jgi:ribonuclease HI
MKLSILDFFNQTESHTAAPVNDSFDYYVYTDGACSNNGKAFAKAGIGIFFSENDSRNVSKPVVGKQSNNTAELGAIIHLYNIIQSDIMQGKKIGIMSDSEYAIKCVTSYGNKCETQGWTKDMPNKELVKHAYDLYKDTSNVKFIHVKAHTGKKDMHSIGNEWADRLANEAIGVEACPYAMQQNLKLYLNVPFAKKDDVKKMGGRWDANKKKWYIMNSAHNKDDVLALFSTAQ